MRFFTATKINGIAVRASKGKMNIGNSGTVGVEVGVLVEVVLVELEVGLLLEDPATTAVTALAVS